MSETRKKLSELSQGNAGNATERINFRQQNKAWLKKSQAIAVRILSTLRAKSMTQLQLAALMNVSAQQVNKIIKGKENLTLETISKLETALDISLFEMPSVVNRMPYKKMELQGYKPVACSEVIKSYKDYNPEVTFDEIPSSLVEEQYA